MSSRLLMGWLEREIPPLRSRGHGSLADQLIALQRLNDFPHLEHYLFGLERLRQRSDEQGEIEWERLFRYLIGRTQAFPLDRPGAALDDLAALNAEFATAGESSAPLRVLAQLELVRAYHKIDAPGFCDIILASLRELWPQFARDPGPEFELLDVWWRTGYWSGRPELMREGLELGAQSAGVAVGSWPYWQARMLNLSGDWKRARVILDALVQVESVGRGHDELWTLYLEVERAESLRLGGEREKARNLLDGHRGVAESSGDPMGAWDHAAVSARVAADLGDLHTCRASWQTALGVVEPLGMLRLTAEFAVELAERSLEPGAEASLTRARDALRKAWPGLRSQADLEVRVHKVGGI